MKHLFVGLFLFPIIIFSQSRDLPPNPEAGKCYTRCLVDGKFRQWKEINCSLVKYKSLSIENIKSGIYSENDEKVIRKKLLRFLKKDFTIEIKSHYDSNATKEVNSLYSMQKAKQLGGYLLSKGIRPDQIRIKAVGNSEPIEICFDKSNCSKIYNTNTRLQYKIINSLTAKEDSYWCYDIKNGWQIKKRK